MDNYNTGSYINEDIFGFVPPNLMYPDDNHRNRHGLMEERARREYEINHTDTLHITDMSPIRKTF
ncbi:MAG: hypothetical protein IJB96_00605 [Lachnospira sp.]|nr:hypothetical protein [Lachnospira sp.]